VCSRGLVSLRVLRHGPQLALSVGIGQSQCRKGAIDPNLQQCRFLPLTPWSQFPKCGGAVAAIFPTDAANAVCNVDASLFEASAFNSLCFSLLSHQFITSTIPSSGPGTRREVSRQLRLSLCPCRPLLRLSSSFSSSPTSLSRNTPRVIDISTYSTGPARIKSVHSNCQTHSQDLHGIRYAHCCHSWKRTKRSFDRTYSNFGHLSVRVLRLDLLVDLPSLQ